jgi:hypothetical protein
MQAGAMHAQVATQQQMQAWLQPQMLLQSVLTAAEGALAMVFGLIGCQLLLQQRSDVTLPAMQQSLQHAHGKRGLCCSLQDSWVVAATGALAWLANTSWQHVFEHCHW